MKIELPKQKPYPLEDMTCLFTMIIPTELTIFIPQAPTFEILGFFSDSMSEITSTLTLPARILRFPQIQTQRTRSTQLRNQEKVNNQTKS